MSSPAGLAAASARLAPLLARHLVRTSLDTYAALGELVGAELLVKAEHRQRTGSFKARGALAKLLSVAPEDRERGVVTASSGNHGLGVANACRVLGGHALVYVPETASPVKREALRRLGAEVRTVPDAADVEAVARTHAVVEGLAYVPPYNDPEVIAGQGTLAVELCEQLGDRALDAVYVSVGGGGLVSGVAAVVKQRLPGVRVVGASPVVDAAMAASVRAGHVVAVDARPTLSDGTAGPVEDGSITLDLCRELVDDWVLVGEQAIAAALQAVIDTEHELVEGSAAVAFAAAVADGPRFAGGRVAVVSCGSNISAAALVEALGRTR